MESHMISLKCRKCGAIINAEQKKCPKCGAPVLLKVMMEEEKRHLSAKEIREKDKRMRREYEKINKEKELKRQKAEKKEEKKEQARQKAKAELELRQQKETVKIAKYEEKQKAKAEKAAVSAKLKEDKKAQKLAKKAIDSKKKFPDWANALIAAVIVVGIILAVGLTVLSLTRPDNAPVNTDEIEVPVVTEEVIEELPEEPVQEEPIEETPEEQPQEPVPQAEDPQPPKEESVETKPVRNITRNNYLFPSDSQYLTESDVNGLSQFDTGLIRNEIYARKGYVFKDEPYKSYFNSQAWYNPNPSAKLRLNETEKYNVNFLLEYERSQGWR